MMREILKNIILNKENIPIVSGVKYKNISKFNSEFSELKHLRNFVQNSCNEAFENSIQLTFQLQFAINEAFCNIVKHSYKEAPGKIILIQSKIFDDGLLFQLSDKGISFNPDDIPKPDFTGNHESGFGWHIIKEIADYIIYVPKISENAWNHLSIFKQYILQGDL